jgi:hypothetical protein
MSRTTPSNSTRLAVLEPGEEAPQRGRPGAGQVGVADHRQAAGDDHRRELARAALALDLDDVAGAARRQVVFELAGEDVDAGRPVLDHQHVPGAVDQREAGPHLDLVPERRVARIESSDLVDRRQHAPGAAGEDALLEGDEVVDRREPEAAQRLSARADAGRPDGAADPHLRAEQAGEEPAGDAVRVDVVLDAAGRRRDPDAVGGGREGLQLRFELDALPQEARHRQLAGLDQHGVRHLARRD